jgi:hypothetical protein
MLLIGMMALTGCHPAFDSSWQTPVDGEAQIELSPTSGRAETEVRVRGTHFPPSTKILVYFGEISADSVPEALVSATTDDEGSFNLIILIPSQWPNGDPVVERDLVIGGATEDHTVTALASFTLEPGGSSTSPRLVLSPDTGQPGEWISVTGHDFPPDTRLALRLGVPQVGLDEINLTITTSGSDGQFVVRLRFPNVWPSTNSPVIEETLLIAAVDESVGQTLASTTFLNLSADMPVTEQPNH